MSTLNEVPTSQSFASLLQVVERHGGPEGLLKSLRPPRTAAPDVQKVETHERPPMNPLIYVRADIKILPDLPWKDFYLITVSDEHNTIQGCGIGHLPGVVGATLNNASYTYNARPGVSAVLPPNEVTFKWLDPSEGGTDNPEYCLCDVYSNGKHAMRLGGWAAEQRGLIGTYGIMHWTQKPKDE